ncbi:hypothetical protein XCR_3975 [Xanthomonas campestris pv. raphani 756C]|nr:hypothetical protein XCR_3975 [Xanthomonas campestris pv. raphani 756C]
MTAAVHKIPGRKPDKAGVACCCNDACERCTASPPPVRWPPDRSAQAPAQRR